MRRLRATIGPAVVAASLLLISAVGTAAAQPAPQGAAPAAVAAVAAARPAPPRYHLGQLKHSVQTLNNCGPASVVSVLSYYGFDVSQEEARQVLRPYAESRGMGWQVIAPYIAKFGLQTRPRINGNTEILKALIANDIPVIVLQHISETWTLGHFRVVQGYDDNLGVFYVNDSLLGPNVAISYQSFDARWQSLNYSWSRYLPIYPPEREDIVAAALGDDWSDVGMYTRALPAVRAAAAEKPDDRTAWNRLVEALIGAEQYRDAMTALDRGPVGGRGFSLNSATRVKILTKTGRYPEALAAADMALARTYGDSRDAASLWLYKAEALRGMGRIDEARAAYQRALKADTRLTEAAQGLAAIGG